MVGRARPTRTLTIAVLMLAAGPPAAMSASTALLAQATQPGGAQTETQASERSDTEVAAREMRSLYTTLTVTLLLLLAFVVGTYVMVRVGRAMVHRPRRREPTRYVDAWSGYRLSEQEIERVTGETDVTDYEPDSGSDDDTDEQPDRDIDGQR
jgi:hypothetical protein